MLSGRRYTDRQGQTGSERRVQVMKEHKAACCSSAAAILSAMALGCVANWFRNRTLHCAITGPLFLIAAVVFLLSDVSKTHVNSHLVWPFVLIGVGIAFLLEWRYTRLSAS